MNPGTEVVGPRNIRHKLRNINEAIRKADPTVRSCRLSHDIDLRIMQMYCIYNTMFNFMLHPEGWEELDWRQFA